MKTIYVSFEKPNVMNFAIVYQIFKENLLECLNTGIELEEIKYNYQMGFLTANEYHGQSVNSYINEHKEVVILFNVEKKCQGCKCLLTCKDIETFQVGGHIKNRSTIADIEVKGDYKIPTTDEVMELLIGALKDSDTLIVWFIRNFMYFVTNYSHDWILKCFEGNEHLINKYKILAKHLKFGENLPMKFFFELSVPNQEKMIKWVNENTKYIN